MKSPELPSVSSLQEYASQVDAGLEAEGYRKIGVALFIIDRKTQRIWVVREQQNKTSTARQVGDVTIPLETRKRGETLLQAVVGTLEEFRPLVETDHLYWSIDVQANSYQQDMQLAAGVQADVVCVVLDQNSQSRITSSTISPEVKGMGWLTIDELLTRTDLREGVREILLEVRQREIIQRITEPDRNVVSPPEFSLPAVQTYLRIRGQQDDISVSTTKVSAR